MRTPTYGELRNRITIYGTEWLQPKMKAFMNTKLYESNKEYTEVEKMKVNRLIRILRIKSDAKTFVKRILFKVKHGF